MAPEPTVETAVLAIADALGAGGGFSDPDIGYAHAIAGRIRQGTPLSPRHQRAAWRLLARYTDQLAAAGIDYAALPEPPVTDTAPHRPPGAAVRVQITPTGRIFTQTPFSARDAMRAIPGGRWHKQSTCPSCVAGTGACGFPADGWHYPATPAAALAVHEALAPFGYSWDEEFRALGLRARSGQHAGRLRAADDLPPIPGIATSAWMHQRQAYWFGIEQDAVLLDMEMGTGKSLVAVALTANKAAASTLVVCPDRVVGVWPKQFDLHAPDAFHVVDGRRVTRTGETVFRKVADRVMEFGEALECRCGRQHVVVANYAITIHEPFASWSADQDWGALVLDEVHKIKAPNGKWSRWAMRVGRAADFRMGLTGTLMPHSPLDVFAPIRALDEGLLGTSVTKFRARYAVMGGYAGKQVVDVQNTDELTELVSRITYRVGAEVLDLPAEVPDVTYTCTLGTKARRLYAQIEDELFAEISASLASGESVTDSITADNVLTKLIRLQQITGGSVRTDEGLDLEVDTAKADLLEQVLDDIPADLPVVVFAKFHHDLDVVRRVAVERLGRSYAELSGRRSDALNPDATLSQDCQVAGVQIQSGGTGVDFTRSHYAVYYSVGYSLGDYLQSRKRLARPGQTQAVRFLHLLAEATVDSDIYKALAAREDVARFVGGLILARQHAGAGGEAVGSLVSEAMAAADAAAR